MEEKKDGRKERRNEVGGKKIKVEKQEEMKEERREGKIRKGKKKGRKLEMEKQENKAKS